MPTDKPQMMEPGTKPEVPPRPKPTSCQDDYGNYWKVYESADTEAYMDALEAECAALAERVEEMELTSLCSGESAAYWPRPL